MARSAKHRDNPRFCAITPEHHPQGRQSAHVNQTWHQSLFASTWSRNLPRDVQSEIMAAASSHRLEQDAEVIRQGAPFSGLICLLTGEMHVIGTARCGDELLMGVLRPNDWTGFLAALDQGCYAFSVRAMIECRVARLDAAATQRIFERDLARFKLLLAPELAVSRGTYHYFVETSYRPPMLRLAERMIGLGRWPYSVAPGEASRLEKISQTDLANATRLSRQTINVCLGRLAEQGIVKVGYRTVEVIDLHRLGLIATGDLVLE